MNNNIFSIQTKEIEDAMVTTKIEIDNARELIKTNTAKLKKLQSALTAIKQINKDLNPSYLEDIPSVVNGTTYDTVVLDDMGTASSVDNTPEPVGDITTANSFNDIF